MLETIPHPTPTRDFNNVVLKIKAAAPDIVIPADYYNEYVLLARTMQQQKVRPKAAIYSVLGGAASSYKFVKEFPEAAQYIMDCNHWFDPRNAKAQALKKKVEAKGQFFTYEVYLNYCCVGAPGRRPRARGSADRAKIIAALASSTWSGHVMPYGPTKFVNGQNQGAAPVNTQVHRQRHQGDPAGGLRVGEAGLSDAAGLMTAARAAPLRRPFPHFQSSESVLSPVILIPAILNGLLTGAVYALVALGLTLIYGVLHIINFAHGALLSAAMFAAFFAYHQLGLDPYLAAFLLAPAFFAFGYALQRFVIGPASHGDDRNMLLVTLGIAIVIENALLYAFRADTRTIDVPYAFQTIDFGFTFLAVPARDRFRGGLCRRAAAVADHELGPISARRSAPSPRRSSAPSSSASTSRMSTR